MSRFPPFCAFSFSKSGENVIQELLNKHLSNLQENHLEIRRVESQAPIGCICNSLSLRGWREEESTGLLSTGYRGTEGKTFSGSHGESKTEKARSVTLPPQLVLRQSIKYFTACPQSLLSSSSSSSDASFKGDFND